MHTDTHTDSHTQSHTKRADGDDDSAGSSDCVCTLRINGVVDVMFCFFFFFTSSVAVISSAAAY